MWLRVRLLAAWTRPGLNSEGELMLTGRRVRNGSPRRLDAPCDHAGAHDASVDCQIRHRDHGNRRCDSHSRPLGWQHRIPYRAHVARRIDRVRLSGSKTGRGYPRIREVRGLVTVRPSCRSSGTEIPAARIEVVHGIDENSEALENVS